MQLSQIAIILAAAATAAAAPSNTPPAPIMGHRYTDSKCKTLHSQPNEKIHIDQCIELETVHSISLNYPDSCALYEGHQCKGKVAAFFNSWNADGKVAGWKGDGDCYDISKGSWPKGKSLVCGWAH